MIRRITILSLGLVLITSMVFAGNVSRFFNYDTTSEVNSVNLNGNLNNIVNTLNGGIDNDNIDTALGYRLYEVLGVLPVAGTLGRTVFYTVDKTLNFDTGSEWYSAVTLLRPPVQGDIVYYNGTNWVVLNTGTKGKALTTGGASANPSWEGMTTQGDIEYHNGTTRTRLAAGTSGDFLKSQGAGANPVWTGNPSLSNVVYNWFGSDVGTTNVFGFYEGTSLNPAMSTYTLTYYFFGAFGSTYRTILTGKFVKIAGISTISVFARSWAETANAGENALVNVDVGGQAVVIDSGNSSTPTWRAAGTIDVSGLTNGTTYDITIQLANENGGRTAYLSGIVLTGS